MCGRRYDVDVMYVFHIIDTQLLHHLNFRTFSSCVMSFRQILAPAGALLPPPLSRFASPRRHHDISDPLLEDSLKKATEKLALPHRSPKITLTYTCL